MKKSLLVASCWLLLHWLLATRALIKLLRRLQATRLLLLRQLLVLRATLRLLLRRQRLLRATLLLQWRRLLRQRRLLRLRAQASKPQRQLKTGPRAGFRLSFLRLSHGSRTGPPQRPCPSSERQPVEARILRGHDHVVPARPQYAAKRLADQFRQVVLLAQVRRDQVLEAAALQRREDVRCGVIAQVAVVAADTRLRDCG